MSNFKKCVTCFKEKREDQFAIRQTDAQGNVKRRGSCKECTSNRARDVYHAQVRALKNEKEMEFDIDEDVDPGSYDPIFKPVPTETQEHNTNKKMEKVLFIPDCHHPYVDLKHWGLMLRAAHQFKPDTVVIMGDFADFYAVSSHTKDPRRKQCLRDELEAVRKAIRQVELLGAKTNIYISGNHEDRYDRYIAERAPELHDLISLRDALGLRNWTWVPYKSHFNLGKLHITHDCGNAGADAHKKAQATFEGNVIIGHTHRMAYTVVGNAEGKPHLGAMFGWLGDVESVDYMHRISILRNWAHGFGIGYLLPDGTVHVQPVPIINHQVLIEGKLVS